MNMIRIAAVALLCLAAAGCGRKGPLEAPKSEAPPPRTEARPADTEISPQSPDANPNDQAQPPVPTPDAPPGP
ncbi:MAG: hypothetical protein GC201_06960 [Alphaproteobacteria bacterium]|nr:hypothetical protein [Alphaproteobacteria bacterium]